MLEAQERRDRQVTAAGLEGAVELFKALASPVRLFVVAQLAGESRCVHELSDALRASGREVSQPLLSQHLKVLRDVGLVATTRRGTEITYELLDDHVAHIVDDAIRHSQEEERQ
jgi:ArsR family transcriptional regulator, zinc-responsive transcriptional repressor